MLVFSLGQFNNTPPIHSILAFHQALKELEQEGGVEVVLTYISTIMMSYDNHMWGSEGSFVLSQLSVKVWSQSLQSAKSVKCKIFVNFTIFLLKFVTSTY